MRNVVHLNLINGLEQSSEWVEFRMKQICAFIFGNLQENAYNATTQNPHH